MGFILLKSTLSNQRVFSQLKTGSRKGFTLVELMIVIAIIALLSGIILTSLTGSKAKSRDARRVSDVNQIQLALEQYFNNCGQYPAVDGTGMPATSPGCTVGGNTVNINSFISVIPLDPTNDSGHKYAYAVNNPAMTDYVIHATLESSNAAQQNSFSKTAQVNDNSWATGFTCYDSSTNPLDYCVSTH